MTQSQVSAHLADRIGLTKKQAKTTLAEVTALVVRELKKEGSLRFAGLGIFRKRKSKARMGRNPATGEAIKIPARTRLRFTAAKALKDSVLGADNLNSFQLDREMGCPSRGLLCTKGFVHFRRRHKTITEQTMAEDPLHHQYRSKQSGPQNITLSSSGR